MKTLLAITIILSILSCSKEKTDDKDCIESAKVQFRNMHTDKSIERCSFRLLYYLYDGEFWFTAESPICNLVFTPFDCNGDNPCLVDGVKDDELCDKLRYEAVYQGEIDF